jgi:hypothetical protein
MNRMRLLVVVLLLGAAAHADVSVHAAPLGERGSHAGLLGERGFAGARGGIVPVAVSPLRGWLAVIDQHDSCCVEATLVLHVLSERGKTITEIPFACADLGDCVERLDRPRVNRFLQRHGFIVPADAVAIPMNDYGDEPRSVRAGELSFTRNYDELIVEARHQELKRIGGRLSWAVYLPSKKLLVYRWFNPNIPESDEAYHPPYWGIERVALR